MALLPERFLPVEPTIRQLVREKYPDLNTSPGSAIHDVFILPASVIYQRQRDTSRVLQRNQSLDNYNLMLPEELDRLASNFLVTRRQGTQASGIQRVYFDDVQDVVVDLSSRFTSPNGETFSPVAAVRLTAVELAANRLSNNQYYVDVPIVSDNTGSSAKALAGQISTVTGVVGASRTENLMALSGGDDQESNSELRVRITNSLSNRDLVKRDGIISTIQEAFSNVKSVLVQGYGDEGQNRDKVSIATSISNIVPASFCQKVNLPLDENGEVLWTSAITDQTTTPIGGFVGAIFDLTGLDYGSVVASVDGNTTQNVCIQEGHLVRFSRTSDVDSFNNDFQVTRVETVPVEVGGTPVKVLRLDQTLQDTTPTTNEEDRNEYQIYGKVYTDDFHVGGKIDVYIDTDNEITREVVVNAVPAVTLNSDVGEIPLTSSAQDGFGNSLFENNMGFLSPVITVNKVEQLDFVSDDVVRVLIPGTHYSIVRANVRSKFTAQKDDMLVVRGVEYPVDPTTNQPSLDPSPLFVGQRLRISYVTNPDVATVQAFVDSSSQRDVTKDILILAPSLLNLDIEISYSGEASVEEVQLILSNYVNQLSFGQELCAADVVTVLSHFGVEKVNLPVTLKASREIGNGTTSFIEDTSSITPGTTELFRALPNLSITKK